VRRDHLGVDTLDHKVVEGPTWLPQPNAFDKLKAILLDANRPGLLHDNPMAGVKAPQYDPKRVVIPPSNSYGGYAPPATTASCCSPTC
jgi:hypothetical protein